MRRQIHILTPDNFRKSREFEILNVLKDRKNQTIASITNRLQIISMDTVSSWVFKRYTRWSDLNLMISLDSNLVRLTNFLNSGLVNYEMSGEKRKRYRLSLSFLGFMYFMAYDPASNPKKFEHFNSIRRIYNNFDFSLLEEHQMLEKYLRLNAITGFRIAPGNALFTEYVTQLFPQFVGQRNHHDNLVLY